MSHPISPIRYAIGKLLDVFGLSAARSSFLPARNPETRRRFAAYMAKVQPPTDAAALRRTSRLLSAGGSLGRGVVHHAGEAAVSPARRPAFRFMSSAGEIASLRRARAAQRSHPTPFRTLFDALRVR